MYAIRSYYEPLVVALLNQMQGSVEEGELVISCPHQMQLDRLREEDKWTVLLQAVEEAAGRKIPVRLSVSPRITSYNVCYTKLLREAHTRMLKGKGLFGKILMKP